MFPMIGLEEKFVSLLKRTLNLISSDVMFSIVNEVSDWNVEFAVKIGKNVHGRNFNMLSKCVRVHFTYSIESVEFRAKN